MPDRITKDAIMRRYEGSKTALGPAHQGVQLADQWLHVTPEYLQEDCLASYFKLDGFPKTFRVKTPNVPRASVDVAVANVMTGHEPIIDVFLPGNDSQAMHDREDRLQAGLRAHQHAIITSKSENPIRQFTWHTYAHGMGCLATPPSSKDVWPDPPYGKDSAGKARQGRNAKQRMEYARWERKRHQGVPWDMYAVHPRNIFFDPDHDPIWWAVERRMVSGDAIKAQFPRFDASGNTRDRELLIYCDADSYACYLGGFPLLDTQDGADEDGVAPNPCGDIWYDFAWAGMGDVAEDGDFKYRMQGLILPNIPAFRMYFTELNVVEAMRMMNGFPQMILRPRPGFSPQELMSAASQAEFKAYQPGVPTKNAMIYWEPGPVQLPDITQALLTGFDESRRLIEIGVGPSVLRGEWRDETATGQASRREAARLPLLAGKYSIEQALSNSYWKQAQQLKREDAEPIIRAYKGAGKKRIGVLKGEDVTLDMQVNVDLSPPTPSEQAEKLQNLTELLKVNATSRRRVVTLDDSIPEDPDALMTEIDSDRLFDAWLASDRAVALLEAPMQPPPPPTMPDPMMGMQGAPMGPQMGQMPPMVDQSVAGLPIPMQQTMMQPPPLPMLQGPPVEMVP